jgi:hypothetical protein
MTTLDLGHGVRVTACSDDALEVESDVLDLPWMARAGDHPGTAVVFDDTSYEVVMVSDDGERRRWRLEPWVDGEAMRVVVRIGREEVARLAAVRAADQRAVVRGIWIWPVAPILAMAPARLQRHWMADWGFPAHGGTLLSAIAEMGIGGVGLVQGLAMAFGAGWFLGGWLKALVVVGPLMLVEGIVRLHSVLAGDEPMGSVVGLPWLVCDRRGRRLRRSEDARDVPPAPNPLRTTLITALACLAPGSVQARWGRHLKVRPAWFTILGAGAELLGGFVNLERAPPDEPSLQLLVNLFFMIEGVARCFLLVAGGRPIGSVLGIPLGPLLERWMPDVDDQHTSGGLNA